MREIPREPRYFEIFWSVRCLFYSKRWFSRGIPSGLGILVICPDFRFKFKKNGELHQHFKSYPRVIKSLKIWHNLMYFFSIIAMMCFRHLVVAPSSLYSIRAYFFLRSNIFHVSHCEYWTVSHWNKSWTLVSSDFLNKSSSKWSSESTGNCRMSFVFLRIRANCLTPIA